MLLTVSGPAGSGKSTTAEALADALGYDHVSGGDIFRELAAEKGLTPLELNKLAEEDDAIDRDLDRRLRDLAAERENLVLESRLAGWMAGDYADLRIWLDAPEEVREQRIKDREETTWEMRVREVSEVGRYESYYEIDLEDRVFYDLQLNTARWGKAAVFGIVREAIEAYDPEADEGAFETDPPAV